MAITSFNTQAVQYRMLFRCDECNSYPNDVFISEDDYGFIFSFSIHCHGQALKFPITRKFIEEIGGISNLCRYMYDHPLTLFSYSDEENIERWKTRLFHYSRHDRNYTGRTPIEINADSEAVEKKIRKLKMELDKLTGTVSSNLSVTEDKKHRDIEPVNFIQWIRGKLNLDPKLTKNQLHEIFFKECSKLANKGYAFVYQGSPKILMQETYNSDNFVFILVIKNEEIPKPKDLKKWFQEYKI